MMKIFKCPLCRDYSGGLAIIAARSIEEAKKLLRANAKEISHYWNFDKLVEVPELSTNLTVPQIVCYEYYA